VTVFLVVTVVSGSLIVGAGLGVSGRLPDAIEGLLVALAGGALLVSTSLELFEPATEMIEVWVLALAVLAGAAAFSALDRVVDETWGSDSGGGLLAAITLDGLPENPALGVSLIGAGRAGGGGAVRFDPPLQPPRGSGGSEVGPETASRRPLSGARGCVRTRVGTARPW